MSQRTSLCQFLIAIIACAGLAGCRGLARSADTSIPAFNSRVTAPVTAATQNLDPVDGSSVDVVHLASYEPGPNSEPAIVPETEGGPFFQNRDLNGEFPGSSSKLSSTADPNPTGMSDVVTTKLSVDELQQRALANNPTLRQADALVQQAQGNWLQVGLYPNPKLQAQQAANNSALDMFNVFVTQPLVTAHKLQLNRDVASHDIQRAQREAEAQYLRVMNEVHIRFIAALGAQRQIAVAEELLKISEDGVRISEELMAGEQVSEADVLQARLQLNETLVLLRNSRFRLAASWNRLGNVIGETDLPLLPLDGNLEDQVARLDWETSYLRLLANHPHILAAEARIAAARSQVARESVQRRPNLNLTTGLGRDFFTPQYMMYTLNFAITPPAWNKNQGNVSAAMGELHAAVSELNRLELSLRSQLAEAFQRYQSARNEVDVYRELTLPTAERNLVLAEKAYEQGEFGFLRVLTARRDLFTARTGYIEALILLRTAVIEIEGLLLTGGLDRVQSRPIPSNSSGKTTDVGSAQ